MGNRAYQRAGLLRSRAATWLSIVAALILTAALMPPVERASAADTILYRVNAGGPGVSGSPAWEADNPSPYVNAGSSTFSTSATIDMSHPSVPSDTPSSLFQSERWDPGDGEEMQWAFPVVPGDYRVNLYFAEIYTGTFSVGGRVFDVSIENSLVLDDLDVYGQVGGDTALVTSHDVTVTDSNLNIVFGHVAENPAVKAIEIISLQTQPGVLGVSPGLVDFGVVTVGDSVSNAVVLSNLGGSGDPQLTVTGVTLGGADAAEFSHDLVVPVVLDPGETVTVNVAHTAADVGSKTASLSFTHDGSNSPTGSPRCPR